jgi:CelD/BcsL family acetyltransferase involved in cellulose biosynthesis
MKRASEPTLAAPDAAAAHLSHKTSATDAARLPKITVERLDDEAHFQALKREWNELARETAENNVFLRHEWFDAAWRWRQLDAALWLLCVRANDRVIGIVPLVKQRLRRRGLMTRTLRFLAVPDTQSCDVLCAAPLVDIVTDAVVVTLRERRTEWDLLELSHWSAHSRSLAALRARLTPSSTHASDTNLCIDLTGGWTAYYAQLSRRLKKGNNLIANRLQRAVSVISLDRVTGSESSSAEIHEALEAAVMLSARSWKGETGLSLDQPGPGAFIRRLTEHAVTNGWLSLWLLRLDGRPAAMEFQLCYWGQVHALRADFDGSYDRSLSPGSYLNWKLLQAMFDKGLARYWMGPGRNHYKQHWTKAGETLYKLTAYGGTWRGRALALLELTLRPRLKRWLRHGPAAGDDDGEQND